MAGEDFHYKHDAATGSRVILKATVTVEGKNVTFFAAHLYWDSTGGAPAYKDYEDRHVRPSDHNRSWRRSSSTNETRQLAQRVGMRRHAGR